MFFFFRLKLSELEINKLLLYITFFFLFLVFFFPQGKKKGKKKKEPAGPPPVGPWVHKLHLADNGIDGYGDGGSFAPVICMRLFKK